ncbi:cyclase [Actinomadura craniellae]|uniref:Cyclase n=1 Tax=Actinomadura craniellae TaxID=2231787 RepID=A0A365H3M1_9ACTN|nr:SRPBCC family protein [Actinomadura craniellae]RAY13616.1 cyclase [Actinomadura craniellae]
MVKQAITGKLEDVAQKTPVGGLTDELHTDRLVGEAQNLVGVLGKRALSSVADKVESATDRLTDYAEGGGGSGLMSALTGAVAQGGDGGPSLKQKMGGKLLGAGFGAAKNLVKGMFGGKLGGGGRKGGKLKVTNIIETIDVGAPLRLTYDQWTLFQEFPSFMKKVENVNQESDEKLAWQAQVFWSHRRWDATIIEQIPDTRIVWRSTGAKGHVDGAVTFHELAPELTRIVLVLEYHPKGLFEHTGNIWRAQGRRARLELKHFRRHVMVNSLLKQDEVEGWRGEIRDSKVVKDQETAMREEREAAEEGAEGREPAAEEEEAEGREAAAEEEGAAEEEAGEREPAAEEEAEGREPAAEEEGAAEEEEAGEREPAAEEEAAPEEEAEEREAPRRRAPRRVARRTTRSTTTTTTTGPRRTRRTRGAEE